MMQSSTEPAVKPVVILGAGFSRAISACMPVMIELRDRVLEELEIPLSQLDPFSGDLEVWLSALSIEQPWHDPIEVLQQRELLLSATQTINKAILASEHQVIGSDPPSWLLRLVAHWAATETTVLTFNYDQLVERALSHLRITFSAVDLYRGPITTRGIQGGLSVGSSGPPGPVPAVMKLHGSTNWAYNPRVPEAPLIITDQYPVWAAPNPTLSSGYRNIGIYDDLEPLIVPPTGSKGAYYSGASLRVQWSRAAASLRNASSVTIMGYSFPQTDFTSRLFATQIPEATPVEVVDLSEEMSSRIHEFLPRHTVTQNYHGTDAIQNFVDRTCPDLYIGHRGGTDLEGKSFPPCVLKNGETVFVEEQPTQHPVPSVIAYASNVVGQTIDPTISNHTKLDHGDFWNFNPFTLLAERREN